MDKNRSEDFLPASLSPSVTQKADARESAKPIHAAFHSQIFRLQINAFDVVFVAVGPGTTSRDIRAVMIPGATRTTMIRTLTETVSSRYGYEMLGS